jgi:hypothetical protein
MLTAIIEIIHQVPCSPETNVLDLGIWCSLHWAVDKLMRGKCGDTEALVQGVASVWGSVELSTAFGSVWMHLTRELHLIKDDEGGNKSVEKNVESAGLHSMSCLLLLLLLLLVLLQISLQGMAADDIGNLSSVGATDSLQAVLDVLEDNDDEDELYL